MINPLILAAKAYAKQQLNEREFEQCDSVASILTIISKDPDLIAAGYLYMFDVKTLKDVFPGPIKVIEGAPMYASHTLSLAVLFDSLLSGGNLRGTSAESSRKMAESCAFGNEFLRDTVLDYIKLKTKKDAA